MKKEENLKLPELASFLFPIRTRQNFLINGPGGIDSTQHIQTLITPELQKIKNIFATREAQFFDKKFKLFDIMLATLIFN